MNAVGWQLVIRALLPPLRCDGRQRITPASWRQAARQPTGAGRRGSRSWLCSRSRSRYAATPVS